jgi:hypothetical protein
MIFVAVFGLAQHESQRGIGFSVPRETPLS